ncbi:MAG: ribonuclease E activity regulator RraA [gamma proteobacterium symbiont of Bathyaustriella thionipta]|nr:ribonuclease E activity regulator RraA [gamma proteobacterium symbiont of Bathyaustriella thionipta]MCU7949417.1 ribonuclease E activity regulator RraA [gamma proteobacterium symbiont of Bathyaustriella thionipta]MCU7953089.1 ribonuclease E activity regulator RraA [gamma proteobacterium symbiont of Bathyaustriella thionipta]MCU7956004.1 ribonuclease E activity regulator RraA [gamma proteobacterium symbiont of Bathyaustriella thionipta]MCU7968953.1 ribonuclease E activity regulator RraA [gamm
MNTIATADLFDYFPNELQSCEQQFRDLGGKSHFFGRISTVVCRNDNVLIKQKLSEPGEGNVLVVDGGGSLKTALLGDQIAALGAANDWSGLVIYAAVRDIKALGGVNLGIRALGGNPKKSSKTGAGQTDITVHFGNVLFEPGHWIYCDEDGIVVSPRAVHKELAENLA